MDTIKAIKERRSVRNYREEHVSQDVIDKIIEAGLYAASGMNRQSAIIVQVSNKEIRNKLSKINANVMGTDKDPFYGAPDLLIVLADKNIPTYIYDGSLVMGNLMTAAHELGVSSCWIHRAKEMFETDEGKEILKSAGVQGDYEGIGVCIIGHADGEYPEAKPRKENRVYKID